MINAHSVPSADEVNRLYREVQEAAGSYDFARECLDQVHEQTITNLEQAYDRFLAAINARRVSKGKQPYSDISEVPM